MADLPPPLRVSPLIRVGEELTKELCNENYVVACHSISPLYIVTFVLFSVYYSSSSLLYVFIKTNCLLVSGQSSIFKNKVPPSHKQEVMKDLCTVRSRVSSFIGFSEVF